MSPISVGATHSLPATAEVSVTTTRRNQTKSDTATLLHDGIDDTSIPKYCGRLPRNRGSCVERWVQRMSLQTREATLIPFDTREESSPVTRPLVSVVDDDQSVRESLPDLLSQFGCNTHTFASAKEFLASGSIEKTKCLLLDIVMPGMSGLDFQHELRRRGHAIPIIFITACGDKAIRPRVLQQGAIACLFKPFSDTDLLEALNKALSI